MIIDFHTHVFPDKIADKTVSLLEAGSGNRAYSDGKTSGLVERLCEAGADIAINLPVLTSPTQFDSVFRFASELNLEFARSGRILSFAGIHPACEDISGKMRAVSEAGFLGVKIHPDYQGTFINDDGYVEILKCARELGLIVVTHAGVDAAFRDKPVRCTPALALELIENGLSRGNEREVLAVCRPCELSVFGGEGARDNSADRMLTNESLTSRAAYLVKLFGRNEILVSSYLKYAVRRCVDYELAGLDMLVTVVSYNVGAGIGEITKHSVAGLFREFIEKLLWEAVWVGGHWRF